MLNSLSQFLFFVFIAGVEVPSKVGADAHSDGDAVYHRCAYSPFQVTD